MPKPFSFSIFVPDGNPEGLRIFDKFNWTGKGLIFPREEWENIKSREEFSQLGVYIIHGYESYQSSENDDLPTVYIGQGDPIGNRIANHYLRKDFWDSCMVFVSTNNGLNRAHITWLEYALIQKAKETNRSILSNVSIPNEPRLTEADKADTESFFGEINQILPLAGIHVFEHPKRVTRPLDVNDIKPILTKADYLDTVIVAAHNRNFMETFLGKNCWFAIRIGGGMLKKIKYIAAYQTYPISAITHYAPVERIEEYGDKGKYKLDFSESPIELNPHLTLGSNTHLAIQGTRYTSFEKLKKAKTLSDL